MPWHQFIDKSAEPHELALAKTPDDERVWLDYYGSRPDYESRVFVLERAVRQLPQNQQLWVKYLALVRDRVRAGAYDYYNHKAAFLAVNKLFQRCLAALSEISLWKEYLEFLVESQYNEVDFVLDEFSRSLRRLPLESHAEIWPIYLKYAELLDNEISVSIYLKYLQFDNSPQDPTIDEILTRISDYDITASYKLFQTICNHYSELITSDSLANIWLRYLNQIVSIRPVFFVNLCNQGIRRFNDQLSKFYLLLIDYTDDVAAKRSLFVSSIKECASLYDFNTLYENYLKFEEDQLNSVKEEDLDEAMNVYENLINDRPILLNDMLLRQDSDNLDTWFKRFDLVSSDLNKLLTCYVQAITSINPLKCHSSADHTLSEVWITYSQIYSNRKDIKTACLIFEKSVKSKFASIEDLISIYKAWAQLLLQNKRIDEAISLLESVLLQHSENYFNYKDTSVDMNLRLSKSEALWSFYLETLEIYVNDVDKIQSGYNKLIDSKLAKPIHFFNLANFFLDKENIEEAFSTYEKGLRTFNNGEISFEFYNVYLAKLIEINADKERIRDVFDKALSDVSPKLLEPIIILYSEYEFANGLILKSLSLLKDYMKTVQNPYNIANKLIEKLEELNNKEDLREGFQTLLTLNFSNGYFIRLVEKFVAFEVDQKQFKRVRYLYQYLFSNLDPKGLNMMMVDQVWQNWETFELNHGDESTFKEMLRFKRTIKFDEAPSGFVKAASVDSHQNPDQIDIEM